MQQRLRDVLGKIFPEFRQHSQQVPLKTERNSH